MDCLKIEKGSNNTLVLTMIDRCTKWTKFACIPNEKAVTIATAFFNNWVSIFSAPKIEQMFDLNIRLQMLYTPTDLLDGGVVTQQLEYCWCLL